jgi:hypothetical protein
MVLRQAAAALQGFQLLHQEAAGRPRLREALADEAPRAASQAEARPASASRAEVARWAVSTRSGARAPALL